jgi:hypothetical protein
VGQRAVVRKLREERARRRCRENVGNQSGRALDMMSSWYALWLRQNEQLYILR